MTLALGTEGEIETAKDAIFFRGLFINRYATVEFAIAELVSRGSLHPAYSHLGPPPFGPVKKLKRLNKVVGLTGPIADYRADLQPMLDDFARHADHRNFMVHAIMTARSRDEILFSMYDHREGIYSIGELRFGMSDLENIANLLCPLSNEFKRLVATMCREIPLSAV